MAHNRKVVIETPKGCIVQYNGKGGKLKARIVWNEGFGPKYTDKFGTAQAKFDTEVLRLCDKYVPFDTGTLKNSAQLASNIGGGELIWNTPYAKKVYYVSGSTDGLRGRNWGDRCKADNLPHFENFARGLLK